MSKKILVVLSGCGVYDGSEIHESVLILLALAEKGIEYQCAAPNEDQFHVINHTNGEELHETRNVLVESARIARGDILDLAKVSIADFSGLVLPGGFGAAKNLTTWAIEGPQGSINSEVKKVIIDARKLDLPIAAFCMSPVVISKSFEGSQINPKITVGSINESSPYEIGAISEGMESIGSSIEMTKVNEIVVDIENKIVTSPCYMMDANISEINVGIKKAISAFNEFL